MQALRAMWAMFNPVQVQLIRKTAVVNAIKDRLPVYTLTFAYPAEMMQRKQTLGVRIDHGDVVKVCVPNYKPKSYSMSAERADEGEFDITVKVYPNGRASGYLDSVMIGDKISVFKHPACNKRRNAGSHVGLIAYGVGITEALPVAAAELSKPEAESVVLLWASRTDGDTFWHEQIEALRNQHGRRFDSVHIFSRDNQPGALHGRVDSGVLDMVFNARWAETCAVPDLSETSSGSTSKVAVGFRSGARFLSVGTKEMMQATDEMLAELNYPMHEHALLLK
jgi:NAD(P)H-flavin reductase